MSRFRLVFFWKAMRGFSSTTRKQLVHFEPTILLGHYWPGLGLKPLLVKADEGKRGFSAWFQSCRSFFSPLQQLQRLGSPSPRLMAAVCLSRAEEEQQQMWDLSADPHGDVSEDQSCFCSISALVTLVFLDFPPAENEGLWRICFSSSSWWTNPLRASVV